MKIYLSGKITGLSRASVKKSFDHYESIIKQNYPKYKVFNPARLDEMYPNQKYEFYIRICIKELLKSDIIYMTRDWETSLGARLEHNIASLAGITIKYL